jgi:hypothetical protein
MFLQSIVNTKINDNNTRTIIVTGRWWLSGEQQQVDTH